MKDYAAMSDFEINKSVAIALDIDMHFYIPESEGSFQPGFLPTELGPIWQTSAGFVGEFTVSNGNVFNPCNNPADAWPILLEHHIAVVPFDGSMPCAWPAGEGLVSKHLTEDENPLRAGMIVFLKMKEGEND